MAERRLQIVPASARWADEFAAIGGALRQYLGDLALRIDHIGSTAVAGLAAKDIVDIQVSVGDDDALDLVCERLAARGWERRPPTCDHVVPGLAPDSREWTKRLLREPNGQRAVNLHVRVAGRANQRYSLLVRDYLRTHPATAEVYAEAKRRLAELAGDDRGRYAEAKDPITDLIYLPAEEWAGRHGWTPGPSDC